MLASSKSQFIEYFSELDDPRQDGKILYPLEEILFLIFVAVLSCAESWKLIVKFGKIKLELLRKYYPYEYGIPSPSTLCTVMSALDKNTLEPLFNKLFNNLDSFPNELIAIDGKSLKASKRFNEKAIHILNAYATKRGIVIAQKTVDGKTNEITALPELLDEMDIKGCVISTDAMGCQKKVTSKITDKEADYMLAVKANHSNLLNDIESFFNNKKLLKTADFYEEHDKGHGRIEYRKCYSMPINDYFKIEHKDWVNLQNIVLVERSRTYQDKTTTEQQFYITSVKDNNAKVFLNYSREHWSVENKLHWVLDVTFNEDRCTIKKAAENMAIIRKLILNLLKIYKDKRKDKSSINGLRHMASWSDDALNDILSVV
jgi:predicted transposase YbfD/YdcC